jgi:hypothetical protein
MPSAPKSGIVAAAALLLVGGATAGIAWWYNLSRTRQALAYWGPQAVALIRDAPQVRAYHVTIDAGVATGTDDGAPFVHPQTRARLRVLESRDVSRARGLVHLRHALLDDRSFDWLGRPADLGNVEYILTFEQDAARLVVFLSDDFERMAAPGRVSASVRDDEKAAAVSTRPMARGLREYFIDVFD